MRARPTFWMLIVTAMLLLTAWRHPVADIRILTHRADDLAPARVEAAIDLGIAGLKLLVTWSIVEVAAIR